MKNLFLLTLVAGFALAAFGCSTPPVIRHRVSGAHMKSINVTFLGRANQARDDWEKSKKELKEEQAKSDLLAHEARLADAWMKAAQLQVKKVELAKKMGSLPLGMKLDKTPAQAEKELEMARKYRDYTKQLAKYNKTQRDLLKWKIYTAEAKYLEEQVLALHKAQAAEAGKYSKLEYADQSHRVRRKFLILESDSDKLAAELKTLQKDMDANWNPGLTKAAGAAPSPKACPPCPDPVPCPRCVASPKPEPPKFDEPAKAPAGKTPTPAPKPEND
jgi:hypothetical protein